MSNRLLTREQNTHPLEDCYMSNKRKLYPRVWKHQTVCVYLCISECLELKPTNRVLCRDSSLWKRKKTWCFETWLHDRIFSEMFVILCIFLLGKPVCLSTCLYVCLSVFSRPFALPDTPSPTHSSY